MISPTGSHLKGRTVTAAIAVCLGATGCFLTGCGGAHANVKAAGASDAPVVSVVVAPVVQKTVPLFTELTARTDATERWISVPA